MIRCLERGSNVATMGGMYCNDDGRGFMELDTRDMAELGYLPWGRLPLRLV